MLLDRDVLRVEQILIGLEKITRWLAEVPPDDFNPKNELLFDATMMQLIVMGELSAKITKETHKASLQIPWRELKDLRNLIAHEYLGISPIYIYNFVKNIIPKIKEDMTALHVHLEKNEDRKKNENK